MIQVDPELRDIIAIEQAYVDRPRGKLSCAWRRLTSDGYIVLRLPDGRRVSEHRWLMSQHLQRPLLPGEQVHHRNGNRSDNRIENLEVVELGNHQRLHAALNRARTKVAPADRARIVGRIVP